MQKQNKRQQQIIQNTYDNKATALTAHLEGLYQTRENKLRADFATANKELLQNFINTTKKKDAQLAEELQKNIKNVEFNLRNDLTSSIQAIITTSIPLYLREQLQLTN